MNLKNAPYSITILPDRPTDVATAPISRVREGAVESEAPPYAPITSRSSAPERQQHSRYLVALPVQLEMPGMGKKTKAPEIHSVLTEPQDGDSWQAIVAQQARQQGREY